MGFKTESADKKTYFPSEVNWSAHSILRKHKPVLSLSFLFIYACFFGFFILFSLTVKMPDKVRAEGRLTTTKDPLPIKSPASFIVGKIFVKENQSVKTNQILMTSRETLSAQNKETLKNFLRRMQAVVQTSKDSACSDCLGPLENLSKLYLSIHAQGEIQSLISPVHDHLRELSTAIQHYKQIEGSVADLRMNLKINQQKLNEIKKREAQKILAKEVEQLETSVIADKTRIAEKYQNSKLNITRIKANIVTRVTELESKLDLFDKTFNVLAPFDGYVTNLRVKGEGELLSTGEVLLELVPSGVKLLARIDVSNDDIAKVQVGSEVIVTVDALPEVDYGSVSGRVTEILRTEDVRGDLTGTKGTRSYPVLVEIPKQFLERNGEKANFILGMSVQARVIAGYETIANHFLRNVMKMGEKAGLK